MSASLTLLVKLILNYFIVYRVLELVFPARVFVFKQGYTRIKQGCTPGYTDVK